MTANLESFIRIITKQSSICSRYTSCQYIAKGYFSILFKAYDNRTKKDVALKFFNPDHKSDIYRYKCFKREAELLVRMRGQKNIINIFGEVENFDITLSHPSDQISISFNFEFIPLELADFDFEAYIYGYPDSEDALRNLICFKELCKGVARLHKNNICHRDIKPGNFLVFNDGQIKLSDFGTAISLDSSGYRIGYKYYNPVGDQGYSAPELFCGIGINDPYAFNSDFFSLGAILFELFTKVRLTQVIYSPPSRLLFDIQLLNRLLEKTQNSKERIMIFDKSIEQCIAPHTLPNIYDFNDLVPKSIKLILNRLYKDLANLNYNNRINDFISIMRQIDICIIVLKNERRQKRNKKEKL